MPTMLRVPDVIGVHLTGALPPAVLATDLALTVTRLLREIGVSGEFVEFYGPGVSTLTAGDRAVVANMAPEYGATTGFFPVDAATLAYLRATGRREDQVQLAEAGARALGLWYDPAATPRYTRSISVDLATIGHHVAGPRRPQDQMDHGDIAKALDAVGFVPRAVRAGALPKYAVAIAAITSCTNTSDPKLLIAAGLLARKARAMGLKAPAWVKTSMAPGSPAAASYLQRAGLADDLNAVGFGIVGFGCTTCIGNPGPLTLPVREAIAAGECQPVAILSGNRNFPGRVHPDLELSFIMSPPLVIAFSLAGRADVNLREEPVQATPDGRAIYLRDLWPTDAEVAHHLAQAAEPADYRRDFAIASQNPLWHALEAPSTPRFPWDTDSNALRRPPFASFSEGSQLGVFTAWPLMLLGDDITTDHLSPASAIPPDSLVADYLVARGESRNDLNVFASRRGNWEVMVRATFHSKTVGNRLHPDLPVAHTLHVPSGEVQPIWDVAKRYREAGDSVVVVAGERYGTGSSRDWAAKGQRLLGIRAVVACSFERIHRSNLIGMGILPVKLPTGMHPETLALQAGDRLEIQADADSLQARGSITVRLLRTDGRLETLQCTAAVETRLEIDLLRQGGVMPRILNQTRERLAAATA